MMDSTVHCLLNLGLALSHNTMDNLYLLSLELAITCLIDEQYSALSPKSWTGIVSQHHGQFVSPKS